MKARTLMSVLITLEMDQEEAIDLVEEVGGILRSDPAVGVAKANIKYPHLHILRNALGDVIEEAEEEEEEEEESEDPSDKRKARIRKRKASSIAQNWKRRKAVKK